MPFSESGPKEREGKIVRRSRAQEEPTEGEEQAGARGAFKGPVGIAGQDAARKVPLSAPSSSQTLHCALAAEKEVLVTLGVQGAPLQNVLPSPSTLPRPGEGGVPGDRSPGSGRRRHQHRAANGPQQAQQAPAAQSERGCCLVSSCVRNTSIYSCSHETLRPHTRSCTHAHTLWSDILRGTEDKSGCPHWTGHNSWLSHGTRLLPSTVDTGGGGGGALVLHQGFWNGPHPTHMS